MTLNSNLHFSQGEPVTCLNPCSVLFRGPGFAVLLLWLFASRTLCGLFLSSAKANAVLSLWDVFSWSTKLYLEIWVFQPWRRTFVFTQNLRQDRRRCLVFGDVTHMWFLAGYTRSVEWKALRSSWLHSTAQESLPDFSGQFKSAQTLACSFLCKWEGMSICAGGLTPSQNSLC